MPWSTCDGDLILMRYQTEECRFHESVEKVAQLTTLCDHPGSGVKSRAVSGSYSFLLFSDDSDSELRRSKEPVLIAWRFLRTQCEGSRYFCTRVSLFTPQITIACNRVTLRHHFVGQRVGIWPCPDSRDSHRMRLVGLHEVSQG